MFNLLYGSMSANLFIVTRVYLYILIEHNNFPTTKLKSTRAPNIHRLLELSVKQ